MHQYYGETTTCFSTVLRVRPLQKKCETGTLPPRSPVERTGMGEVIIRNAGEDIIEHSVVRY